MSLETTDHRRVDGIVFYDGECSMCRRGARRLGRALARRRLELAPLQAPDACARLGVAEDDRLKEMRLRLEDGTVFGGAAAVIEVARRIWWAWPLWALSRLPGAMRLMRAAYGWVARHRGCASGACRIDAPASRPGVGVLPLIVLPAIAVLVRPWLPPWAFMWTMAAALYAGCKWLSYRDACSHGVQPSRVRALEFLVVWPGMDAAAFLSRLSGEARACRLGMDHGGSQDGFRRRASLGRCARGFARTPDARRMAGHGRRGLRSSLRHVPPAVAGLAPRRRQRDARDASPAPLGVAGGFLGRRWNTAFHELATRFSFEPLRARVGASTAALLVFLLSGLIHELVISVPAHGGYGLPTGYFVVQGLGVAGERSRRGRRLGLGHGWRGRLFAVLVAAGPAYWLFPPPFVHRVVLPMLAAIGGR